MERVSLSLASSDWQPQGAHGEVDALLTRLSARTRHYFDGLWNVTPDEDLLKRTAARAWKLLLNGSNLAYNQDLFTYATHMVTLRPPGSDRIRDLVSQSLVQIPQLSLLEFIPRHLGVDPATNKQAISWQMFRLDQLLKDIATGYSTEQCVSFFTKIFKTQYAMLVYMLEAVPVEEARANYLAYLRRGFYYAVSYLVDEIIDDPKTSPEVKGALDRVIEQILDGQPAAPNNDSPIVVSAIRYLQEFVSEISGAENERALRIHLIAFHRIQRAAQAPNSEHSMMHLSSMKAAMAFYVIPQLFGRQPDEHYWQRLLPAATLGQLNDDLEDYTEDRHAVQTTQVTHYIDHPSRDDPLNLWPRIATSALTGLTPQQQCSIVARVIQKVVSAPLDHISQIWPSKISAGTLRWMNQVTERPTQHCLARRHQHDPLRGERGRLQAAIKRMHCEYSDHQKHVMGALQGLYPDQQNPLHEDMNYVLQGGKCGRSYFIHLIGQHYGVPAEKLLPLMLCVELSQTASLVFDDLPSQDDAHTRRGKACLHTIRPLYEAELSGISLITESFRVLSEWDLSAPVVKRITQLAATDMGPNGLCHGQLLDLKESAVTFEQFEQLYDLKTAKGFHFPLMGAAIACGASPDDLAKFERLAYALGVAYQIRDDLLEDSATDKVSTRVATRLIDVDRDRARDLFHERRREALDLVFELFDGEVQCKFLRLALSLLMLPNESGPKWP